MRVIRTTEDVLDLVEGEVRCLVQQRITMLSEDEPNESATHGYVIVMEIHDATDVVDQHLGFSVLSNRWDGTHFRQPTFTPSFELIEEHKGCYEVVFVLSDSGYGVIVFVPKEHVDRDLLAMCRAHAIPMQEPSI